MSDLGNKEVMAKNLKYYIEHSGKDRRELAEIWGFPYSTITEWINGKKYPRIDRIEIMANYFGILKSDLIEEHKQSTNQEVVQPQLSQQKQEFIKRVESMSDEQLDILEKLLDVVENKG
jgi:transcriptional regulator with XRE-family HTH domain